MLLMRLAFSIPRYMPHIYIYIFIDTRICHFLIIILFLIFETAARRVRGDRVYSFHL